MPAKPTSLVRLCVSISKDFREDTWGMRGSATRYEVTGKAPETHTLLEIPDEHDTRPRSCWRKTRIDAKDILRVERSTFSKDESIRLSIYFAPAQEAEARQLMRAKFEALSARLLENATAIRNVWLDHLNKPKTPIINARPRTRST